ncbi:GNAT family protein [Clostridium boliviensis]|uniref:GNAT family protein n=1 Tax=Clostridium boliviensis TaxID=318465 RepID=A0ABU4GT18_9CLOT|nr:GNAT family protein [Clostridium boliviensis]MDW2800693.1 GNAT family protein [Clostridium boliviensis]
MNLILKKWDIADKNALIKICNEADRQYISNRLPFPYTESDAQWWLNMVQEKEGKDGIFRAIIMNGECVGNITVEKKNDVQCKDAEIGYLLLTNKWSQGIMTEAVRQICLIAFKELNIIRITGLVYKPNIASQRVLEKNDFILEGIMRNAVYKNDNIYDMCIYGKCL